jgi:hypothetical protein
MSEKIPTKFIDIETEELIFEDSYQVMPVKEGNYFILQGTRYIIESCDFVYETKEINKKLVYLTPDRLLHLNPDGPIGKLSLNNVSIPAFPPNLLFTTFIKEDKFYCKSLNVIIYKQNSSHQNHDLRHLCIYTETNKQKSNSYIGGPLEYCWVDELITRHGLELPGYWSRENEKNINSYWWIENEKGLDFIYDIQTTKEFNIYLHKL